MCRPFAVFDIDGTLIRWQLYHAIADEMAIQGFIDPKIYNQIVESRLLWKKRTSEDSYKEYERCLVHLTDPAFQKMDVQKYLEVCRKVIEEYRDQVYTFTRDLIRNLKSEGYLLFGISGSQDEIIGMLADYYAFDDYAGSRFEINNGRFTGKKDILLSRRKPEVLDTLVTKHHASFKGSVGIGDSEGDISMLESVDYQIAFNPTKLLFEHAKSRGWKIVIERKNVIYEMEPENAKYQLK